MNNSSSDCPIETVKCKYLFVHVIIIVEDADGDIKRCRWANGSLGECGGVCNAFPNAVLDMV